MKIYSGIFVADLFIWFSTTSMIRAELCRNDVPKLREDNLHSHYVET